MYIKHKPVAAFYKLILGTLALVMQWLLMGYYGLEALGLFATWVLFIAAVYFLSSALILALSHSQESGKNPCPMLEGMIIMAFLLINVVSIMYGDPFIQSFAQANGFANFVICWILPVLAILDWALFVKKGRWRAMVPFYWLAFPVCYLATMILLWGVTSDEVLQLALDDLYASLVTFLIFVTIELAVGYLFYLLDYALSGKLAKKIVLPHLQTVIVDAEGREISREPTAEDFLDTDDNAEKPAQKPIILEKINKPAESQKTYKSQPKTSQKSRNKSKRRHNHTNSKNHPENNSKKSQPNNN